MSTRTTIGRSGNTSQVRTVLSTAWKHKLFSIAALTGLLGLAVTVVPASVSNASPANRALSHIGGSVTLWAEWTSTEQQDFEAVLAPFEAETGVTINYSGKGSNMDTAIDAAVAGGAPPQVALVPDPGTVLALAKKGAIQPLAPVLGSEVSDYGSAWNNLVTYNKKLYGVWFKGANKNSIWYNPAEFAVAGIKTPPTTWQQLLTDAATLKRAGVTPFSLCTGIGWPVADLWQNVYLKTAGAASYDALAAHNISWESPTVTTAFNTLAELVGQPSYLLGGTAGSLDNPYPTCADKVFPKPGSMPQAAMVIEADFVVIEIVGNSANYTAGTTGAGGKKCTLSPAATPCYDFFPFPAPAADQKNNSAIQGSGDVAMLFKPTAAAKALIKYLGSPEAGEIWAHLGGFASPNKMVPLTSYPDPVTEADAYELQHATSFVFSLDDLQGSWEPSLWQDMLNFVKKPSATSIASIEKTMQAQATAALGH
ncbi:MAG: ABC transporter substrate-binding protein [Acidimicrobiales bacterium]